jgi:hypothetical protein
LYGGDQIALNANSTNSGFLLINAFLGVNGATFSTFGFTDYVMYSPYASGTGTVRFGFGSGLTTGSAAATGEYIQLPNNTAVGFRNDNDNGTIKGIGYHDNLLFLSENEGKINVGNNSVGGIFRIGLDNTQIATHNCVVPNQGAYAGEKADSSTSIEIASVNALDQVTLGTIAYPTRIYGSSMGFFGATAVVQPNLTGAKGGGAVLTSICSALAALGLCTDSTT